MNSELDQSENIKSELDIFEKEVSEIPKWQSLSWQKLDSKKD